MNETITQEAQTIGLVEIVEPVRHAVAAAAPPVAAPAPQPAPGGTAMLMRIIETSAGRPDMDPVKIHALIDIFERWHAREAKQAYIGAMADLKTEALEILKRKGVGYTTKEGVFVGYMHAELSDVTDVLVPAMARHGLSHSWNPVQEGGKIKIECIVTHRMGHSEVRSMEAPPDVSGKKNSIQAIASTTTYLERYTLLAAMGMATKGMDDDGRGGEGDDDGNDDAGEDTGRRPPPPPPPPAKAREFTDEEFAANLPAWIDRITLDDPPKDPDRLMSFIETKGRAFTEEQKKKLRGYKPPF